MIQMINQKRILIPRSFFVRPGLPTQLHPTLAPSRPVTVVHCHFVRFTVTGIVRKFHPRSLGICDACIKCNRTLDILYHTIYFMKSRYIKVDPYFKRYTDFKNLI